MVKHGILHVHSTYSIHDSAQSPEEIVLKAKQIGCNNITLTDHGTLMGIDDFMDAGKKHGINTIPGVEAYMEGRMHLVLIAKNYSGFQAISKALRDANEHQEVLKIKGTDLVYPIMTKEILENLRGNAEIIVSSACIQGPVCVPLLKNFKIQKQIDKINSKLAELEPFYRAYCEAYKLYEEHKEKCHAYSKEITAFSKYTKEPYALQLQKKQIQLDKLKEDIESLKDDPKKSSKLTKAEEKYIALSHEIEIRKTNRDNAFEVVAFNQKKLDIHTGKKIKYKKIADDNKSKKERYEKYMAEISKIELIPEKELLQEAYDTARYFSQLFPNFYLELQNHGLEQEKYVMPKLVRISEELHIPLIAANDAHMNDGSEDSITARQILRYNYFGKHQEVYDPDKELYLKNDEELFTALSEVVSDDDAKKAIENTKILEDCHVVFPSEKHYPTCESEKSFLELLENARLKMIASGKWNDIYEARLRHEIDVIQKMGFEDYHMVVRDFCIAGRNLGVVPKHDLPYMPVDYEKALAWIQERGYQTGIGVGPGRGSAAGSLVCYLLGITNIDPIEYNLLFERFLNPERVSMPDIDTDIKTSLRPYIIRYIKQKYGEHAVTSILTVTTYAPRASIQMVGRDRADELYGNLPTAEGNEKKREYLKLVRKISDLVPETGADSLSKWDTLFYDTFGDNEECVLLWNRAKRIEGKVSGTGVHAGGVVISDNDNINEYVPLSWNSEKQVWVTQCDKERVEEKGMLKFDILGLRYLDCISDCVLLVKQNHGITIDLDHLPFEPEVFQSIYASGQTNSVFQVESAGMKNMLQEFQPTCFEDIILLVSMYRPGPMQFIPNIIAVKHGEKKVSYKTPELEAILGSTYGAIAYQEQVMEIFQTLAGYSLGQADLVRRAMAKKKEEKLKIEKNAFLYGDSERNIIGCVNNGIAEKAASELFEEVLDFAKYAFNRSHAAAYAYVSYQSAYLKYHYPKEYLCAMFNNKESEQYEPIIEDCAYYGIEILPPDINSSFFEFTIDGNAIRYGFSGIKGIADAGSVEQIVSKRNGVHTGFYYKSFQEFARTFLETEDTKCSLFEKRIMDALIKSGSFEEISNDRVSLYEYYENIPFKDGSAAVYSYLNKPIELHSGSKESKLIREWELEYLKYFLRENPLKAYRDDAYYGCIPFSQLNDGKVNVFGLITSYESKISKAGNKMLILNIQGKAGKATVLFLKDKCEQYEHEVKNYEGSVVRIKGSCKDGSIFGSSIEPLDALKTSYYYICDSEEKYRLMQELLPENAGLEELNIFTFYSGNGEIHELQTPVMVRKSVTKKFIKKIGAVKEKK